MEAIKTQDNHDGILILFKDFDYAREGGESCSQPGTAIRSGTAAPKLTESQENALRRATTRTRE